ncbi:hypothetical protein [Aminipila terrae]|uniref:Uncharacterized protein n=1 Tax=Aminipila terrae TaxID=2697030 RepID=A0A6P1M9X5_9FIRM|nr:hypothetical protein [Aminipila terrae]QHI71430.1 hypothetical protein Ami3637_02675 [Aminipila terrae]
MILLILVGLVLGGIKYGPTLMDKANIPEHLAKITESIKSKIPFLNKEKEPAAEVWNLKEGYICETKLIEDGHKLIFAAVNIIGE